jgi:hypothetical protein
MKKYYLLALTIGLAITCFSQAQLYRSPAKKLLVDKNAFRATKKSSATSKTASGNQGWFNYGIAAESSYSTTSSYGSSYLFPDSTVQGEFEGGTFGCMWIHHMAEVVDFRSQVFQSDASTAWVAANPTGQIKIDSLSIIYGYTRVQTNVVDTLIVTFYNGPTTGTGVFENRIMLNSFGYPGGADTLTLRTAGYNSALNTIAAASPTTSVPAGQMVFKLLLTQADTATVYSKENAFALPTPFIGSADNLYCASIQFKPGYAYSQGEQVNYTANVFRFITTEENGPNTFMNYADCNANSASCDYSNSSVITMYERYDMGLLWNGHFTTGYSLPDPSYPYEHHLLSFHVTDDLYPCTATAQFSVTADTLNPGTYNAYESSTGTGTLSYVWDFGDNTTSALHYPSHSYAVPGQYVVCLTVTANTGSTTCTDTYCDSSSVHRVASGFVMNQFNVIDPMIVTGVKQIENMYLSAYPNPIADELIIQNTNSAPASLNYVLTDALGRTVFLGSLQTEKTTLNTTKLAKGFYNLQVTNANGNLVKTIKLIK